MTGQEIARELISILLVNYGINSMKLLACIHDLAAANGVVFPTVVDIGCYPHTLEKNLIYLCWINLSDYGS